ncbi:MAG: hypothetical protein M3245_03630 [Actinomycetota bacterium]|nr:hypothetical protein [Actinomycetota bacterium]
MRRRMLVPFAAVVAIVMAAGPASALHGPTGEDFTPNDRLERVYFHCEGATKLHNTVTDASIPWSTAAPTQSVQAGAGCGSMDNGLWGNNQVSIQDSHFQGSFAGNIDRITVEAHNIYLGPARSNGPFTVNVRLLIDGEPKLGAAGKNVTLTPVRSSTGASEMLRFTITGLNLMDEANDMEHDVLLTLAGGAFVVNGQLWPVHDTQSVWVYDTTEVPSGLTFNPETTEAATIQA